jgi:hypothetical protein
VLEAFGARLAVVACGGAGDQRDAETDRCDAGEERERT